MNITISIPKNDYVTPTECRQEVVQAICDAFLRRCAWSSFRPHSSSVYRQATLKVVAHKDGKFYGFHDKPFDGDISYNIRGCEMRAAFDALIKAGYHMFAYDEFSDGTTKAYRLSKSRTLDGIRGAREVYSFIDIID